MHLVVSAWYDIISHAIIVFSFVVSALYIWCSMEEWISELHWEILPSTSLHKRGDEGHSFTESYKVHSKHTDILGSMSHIIFAIY